jgi:SAM-dependent methyltransferase
MTARLLRRFRFAVSMGPGYLLYKLAALASAPRLRMRAHLDRFQGVGLEIGGPSAIFAADGLIPVYNVADRMDNILFSERTHWEGAVAPGLTFKFSDTRPPGNQYILDGSALSQLPNGSYDFIVSSHMLEHSANPIATLHQWKRLLKQHASLLLVLPHRDGTFDHHRPVTTLQHLLDDYASGVGEDDATHLAEILRLHDLWRDPEQQSRADFERWILDNRVNRGAHHHVFDTHTAMEMVQAAGLNIIDVEAVRPFHIVLLTANSAKGEADENQALLDVKAEIYRSSPFGSDRRLSR